MGRNAYVAGNLGIGTASPGYNLDVSGTLNISLPNINSVALRIYSSLNTTNTIGILPNLGAGGYNSITSANDAGIIWGIGGTSGGETGGFVIAPWATGPTGLRIGNTGNVSINTSTNTSALNVGGAVSTSTTTGALAVSGGVGISGNVFVGGNVSVASSFRPTIITEPFATNAGTTSPYTFDYSTGPTFYITAPPASNFTCNFTNVPADINRTYVATIIIKTSSNRTFCNTVQINNNTAFTPYFANGIPTSIATASMITQTISIQRLVASDAGPNGTNSNILSAVIAYF
jgi:hypothetical protein